MVVEYKPSLYPFSASLDVAVFFAVKGFIEWGDEPRVAIANAPLDRFAFIIDEVALAGTAFYYAQAFQEILITEHCCHLVEAEKVLRLPQEYLDDFEEHTYSFSSFLDKYRDSMLENWIRSCQQETKLNVEVDLVGLSHYRSRHNGRVNGTRLIPEDDNEYDRGNLWSRQ